MVATNELTKPLDEELNEGIVDDIDFEPVHERIPVTLEIVSVSKYVPKIELDEVEELSDDNDY